VREGSLLSVVIPARDEAGALAGLLEELHAALSPCGPYEVLVVDDGSRDATLAQLRAVQARGELPLRILRHRRPLGQSAALRSGILAARGEWVATLDGDGQNDPADVPRLVEALRRDAGRGDLLLLCGWRRRRADPWSRRVASRVANAVRGRILGDRAPDGGCGLKLMQRVAFLELPFFDHQHRFLPALIEQAGGRVISVEVRHRPRRHGRSKYGGADRLAAGLVDLAGVWSMHRRSMRSGADEIGAPVEPPPGAPPRAPALTGRASRPRG
jgi:dolichol-phosphate mannosyltransferase